MSSIEMDRCATLKDAEDVRSDRDAKHLDARREYELANMSPDIRPEHYEQCITQTTVGIVESGGTFLVDVHPVEKDTKPIGSTRVIYDVDTGVITVKAQQPPEKAIDAATVDSEEIKP